MDFSVALATTAQALGIVKQLREIDKGISEAELKSSMADLYGKLADLKIALSDARETIHDKDKQIKVLQDQIATLTSGENCPVCNNGRFKVVASVPDPIFGDLGVLLRTMRCDSCNHTEKHQFDPSDRRR
jgi:hypothetical protein